MKMTEVEFQRIYRYVKLHYGIDMSKKKEIMTGRLKTMWSHMATLPMMPFYECLGDRSDRSYGKSA